MQLKLKDHLIMDYKDSEEYRRHTLALDCYTALLQNPATRIDASKAAERIVGDAFMFADAFIKEVNEKEKDV